MNLSTNPFFIHGINKLCIICHMLLKYTERTHSLFSTLEELESPGPINVLQVLQSFSNFQFYNSPQTQMVCSTCYDKTIEAYKFIQMCNRAHECETDVDVKVEEILGSTRIIIDGRESAEEMGNEKLSKLDELGMVISGTEIKTEEKEGIKTEKINNKEITISYTEIATEQNAGTRDVKIEEICIAPTEIMENEKVSKFDELGMVMSDTEIKIAEWILKEGIKKETGNREETTISHTEIVTGENRDSSYFDILRVEKFDPHYSGKVFTTKSRFNTHIQVHRSESPFICFICKCGFAASSSLHKHLDKHKHNDDVKVYKCELCDRRFPLAANLRRHMETHSGGKTLKCKQCGRHFSRASAKRRHMYSHNGVKAYKCEQCDRRFSVVAQLRRHMDRHNGV